MITRNRSKLFFIALVITFFVSPLFVFAAVDTPEVKADMTVSAFVPTKACAAYSSVTSNVTEILSDASQRATITVKVMDCANLPLSSTEVTLTSNRGAIDKINQVDSDGELLRSGDGQGVSALTDINGYLFFQTYANVAGESVLTARVEDQLDIGQVKLVFLPLPFPKNISVVVEVPKIISPNGQVTIFKPKDYDVDKEKLVNLTMELRIPTWVFYLFIFIIIVNTVMFLTILALIFHIKKLQNIEITHIEKEEALLAKEESEISELISGDKH